MSNTTGAIGQKTIEQELGKSHIISWDDEDSARHLELVLSRYALIDIDPSLIDRLSRVLADIAAFIGRDGATVGEGEKP